MNKRVLVIAAHPDDELLGCGASVAFHASHGDRVRSIILCEGETMRAQDGSEKRSATEEAARILGVAKSSMYEVIRRNNIHHVYVGKRILLPKRNFHKWLEKALSEPGKHLTR